MTFRPHYSRNSYRTGCVVKTPGRRYPLLPYDFRDSHATMHALRAKEMTRLLPAAYALEMFYQFPGLSLSILEPISRPDPVYLPAKIFQN